MKILIFTKNWLGDVIFETPAIRCVRRNFPQAQIVCATPPRCLEILYHNPSVNRVIPFDERDMHQPFKAKLQFVQLLRKERFDKVFLFHRSFTRAFLTFLGGAKERVGYGTKKRGFLLTKSIPDCTEKKHHVHYFLDLLRGAGLKVDVDPYCEFFFSSEEKQSAMTRMNSRGTNVDSFVVLNPGGNRRNKRWPTQYFAELADSIAERYRCSFVITGHQKDDAMASEIIQKSKHSKIVSLCGETNLGELGAVLSKSKLVISGDSGPLHIAAAVGSKVIGLFGPTDPKLTGPMGRGKSIVLTGENRSHRSMQTISARRVFSVINKERLIEK